jgi:ubiquinone/menaquinone biosynthesis C-methylase UbiE
MPAYTTPSDVESPLDREPRTAEGTRVQDDIAVIFDEASGYYRHLRWEKNPVVLLEKAQTHQVLVEELGSGPVGAALEIGCGPGTWTPLLADRAAQVVALDLSPKMLEQARAAVAAEHVSFVQGDAAHFDPGNAFDLVMSVRVLEYVPEWREIIARLERLVAPGGRAVVITKTPVSVWRGTGRSRWFGPRNLLQRLLRRETDPGFWQRHLPVHELTRAFAEAGMVDIRVRPVIIGLPIYVRGTKQYPIIPAFAERPALAATQAVSRWVAGRGRRGRRASLIFAESYAVSGRRAAAPDHVAPRAAAS